MKPRDCSFWYCFNELRVTQWVKKGTFIDLGNILNLIFTIFTIEADRIKMFEAPLPKCHHRPVTFE